MPVELLPPGDPSRLAAELRARAAERFGSAPDAVFAAPGRVNLIGEHLDYNGGRCLPFALPHATYAAVSVRDDGQLCLASTHTDQEWSGSVADLSPEVIDGWAAYAAGTVWALREDGVTTPGLDLLIDSRVPVGAGLSSSAALECAVALAASWAADVPLDDALRHRLVEACKRAENEVAGAATGGLDQNVVMFGRAGHALLLDFADGSARQVPWDPEAHGLALLIVDTRVHHSLNDGGYASRRGDCEKAAERLGVEHLATVTDLDEASSRIDDDRVRRRVRHVLTEQARVDAAVRALEAGELDALGPLFTASHQSLRDDYEVSCAELDAVVDAACSAGALGARMTGGGFGGSAVALVPQDRLDAVERAVAARFEENGWKQPGMLRADPARGAYRIDEDGGNR